MTATIKAEPRLRPGLVTTAKLGNSGDTNWCDKAPVLLLAVNASYNDITFTAIARKPGGRLQLLLNVMENYRRDRMEDPAEEGRLLCTSALYEDQLDRYLGATKADYIREAMKAHKDEIAKLPAFFEQYKVYS